MIDKLKVNNLVTAEQAIELSHFRSISDLYIAREIYDKYTETQNINDWWDFMRMLGAIWNGGRIQGIREERAKKYYE